MVKFWRGVENSLNDDILALAQQLAKMAEDGVTINQWRLARMKRYQSLVAQVQAEIAKYNTKVAPIVSQTQKTAASQGIGNGIAYTTLVGQIGGVEAIFDKLGARATRSIVALAMKGEPLNALLANAYPLAVDGITRELINGTAKGINPRVVARLIIRQGLAQGLNHVLLVSRDQMIRSYREGTRQQYDESGVVVAYRRLATKDSRTCLACLALDGTIYPTSRMMPIHPQDRCLGKGSMILTNRGEKRIEDVIIGDSVWTHKKRFMPVLALSKHKHKGRAIKVKKNGRKLICTPEHKILVERGWVEAQNLMWDNSLKIYEIEIDTDVFDLSVQGDHSYQAEGIIVHNCTMVPVLKNFKPLNFQTGEQWFKSLPVNPTGKKVKGFPEPSQKEIMGPGKHQAWKAGKFDFDQLATLKRHKIWGDSVQPTSLKVLLKGGGGIKPPKIIL